MESLLRRYRLTLGVFVVGLILSGVTAFPLLTELRLLAAWFGNIATITSPLTDSAGGTTPVRNASGASANASNTSVPSDQRSFRSVSERG